MLVRIEQVNLTLWAKIVLRWLTSSYNITALSKRFANRLGSLRPDISSAIVRTSLIGKSRCWICTCRVSIVIGLEHRGDIWTQLVLAIALELALRYLLCRLITQQCHCRSCCKHVCITSLTVTASHALLVVAALVKSIVSLTRLIEFTFALKTLSLWVHFLPHLICYNHWINNKCLYVRRWQLFFLFNLAVVVGVSFNNSHVDRKCFCDNWSCRNTCDGICDWGLLLEILKIKVLRIYWHHTSANLTIFLLHHAYRFRPEEFWFGLLNFSCKNIDKVVISLRSQLFKCFFSFLIRVVWVTRSTIETSIASHFGIILLHYLSQVFLEHSITSFMVVLHVLKIFLPEIFIDTQHSLFTLFDSFLGLHVRSCNDFLRICKPYSPIVILDKVCFHRDYFDIEKLLDVEAHSVNLLNTVFLL